jgi:linoleoyl-CoA desaturase
MGIGMSGLGVATMHDANHGSFSKYTWVNKLFEKSLYVLGGLPANWKYQHNTLHHGYTNVEGHDEDIGHGGILRFSPHKPLKKVHRYQYIYAWALYGLMTFSWITLKDFKRLFKYKRDGAVLDGTGNYSLLFLKLLLSKIVYYAAFLLLPIIVVPVQWYWNVLGFLVMHFVSGLILSTIFQTAHVVPSSDYPLPDDNDEMNSNWTVHQLYTTADFAPNNKVFSWLVGGLNYQVVHHLFPSISHVHYKNLSKIVQEKTQKYNLPYHINGSFFSAVGQHVVMLKTLGRENL